MCPFLHISMFPYLHLLVSMSPYLCKWQMATSLVFCKWKKGNGNFSLFAANRNGKLTFVFLGRQMINSNQWVNTEVSNSTSKCNGNTHYPLCRILTAITFSSDNVSKLERVLQHLKTIIFFCRGKALCDNAQCNIALLLLCNNTRCHRLLTLF